MSGAWGGVGALLMLYLVAGWAGRGGFRGVFGTGVPALDTLHGILVALTFFGVPVFIVGWVAGSLLLRPVERLRNVGLWLGPAAASLLPLPFLAPSTWPGAIVAGGAVAWLCREWMLRRTWRERTKGKKGTVGVW